MKFLKIGKKFGIKDAVAACAWLTLALSLLTVAVINFGLNHWGLRGEVFAGTNFESHLFPVASKTLNFVHHLEIGSKVPPENYSVRWRGTLLAPVEGIYKFSVLADDGVRVTIDNQTLINEWTDNDRNAFEKPLFLTRGSHPLQVEYFNRLHGSTLKLYWERPGLNRKEIIPSWSLRNDPQ